jgi:hypothetical protein
MKIYDGVEVQLHAFLISALDGDERSDLCPRHFTLWTGGWVGPRVSLDVVARD